MGLLIGLSILVMLIGLAGVLTRADPARLARGALVAGSLTLGLIGLALVARGQLGVAALAGAGAMGLWRARSRGLGPMPLGGGPGATSRVRTAGLEMDLDHATGELRGRVLAGAFEGSALDDLDEGQLARLAGNLARDDPESARLLEAYLDRRFPTRGEDAQPHADPGAAPQPPRAGAMTRDEARETLGLKPGAGEEEVRAAHRELMKRLHPDRGGSAALAARVNQAKDVLLRHR